LTGEVLATSFGSERQMTLPDPILGAPARRSARIASTLFIAVTGAELRFDKRDGRNPQKSGRRLAPGAKNSTVC